jgi:hypothetical protein
MIRTGFLPDELPSPWAWTTFEERLLRENYPRGGPKACSTLLPRRSTRAIRQRAYMLGITRMSFDHERAG